MGVLSENAIIGASAAGGYDIDYSCRFNAPDTPYLTRTPSAGNRKTWTVSFWIKLPKNDTSTYGCIWSSCPAAASLPGDVILVETGDANWRFWIDNSSQGDRDCTAVARDPAAWYHIVCYFDSPNQTMGIYVNGELQTAMRATGNPALNYDSETFDGSTPIRIGEPVSTRSGDDCLNMYLAEFHMVEGLALGASDFGETDSLTNEWKPIKYAGSYGNEGFYLKFEDAADLGNDSSGNGNDFTSSGLAASDQMLDTPTNNFPTFNPLTNYPNPQGAGTETLTEGNTRYKITTNAYGSKICNGIVNSGKWYTEILVNDLYLDNQFFAAIASFDNVDESQMFYHCTTGTGDGWGYHNTQPNARTWNMTTEAAVTTGLTAVAVGDIFAIALDLDSSPRSVKFYINNTLAATIADIDTSGTMENIIVGMGERGVDQDMIVNFGQDSSFAGLKTAQGNTDGNGYGDFYYAPPTGYMANCTKNLPDPSIALPGEYFDTALYTGTGSELSVSDLSFQPDFTWIKTRQLAYNNRVFDVVRGVTKELYTNANNAEVTDAQSLKTFDSDGFTLGTSSGVNPSSDSNMVSWNWKAGTSFDPATAGTVASGGSGSANATAGFSIVKYPGSASDVTVGHGLSQAPELILIKNIGVAVSWPVYAAPLGNAKRLELNDPYFEQATTHWVSTSPTASVFTLDGGVQGINNAGDDFIAYCWHSVEGYSKVGSYKGNGNANGTFIETGFRPAYIFIKRTDASNDWRIFDDKRDPINVNYRRLQANLNYAEGTETWNYNDFVSNGFKWRVSDGGYNASGGTYLYMAFAKSPFKTARAR